LVDAGDEFITVPSMNSRVLLLSLLAMALGAGCRSTKPDPTHPMLSVLEQFKHAPAKGPGEAEMPVRVMPTNSIAVRWPGKGLKQHPFLFYGEGNNVLYVVNKGKVIWRYAFPKGGEIDDAWMLSNGNIICTKMTDCYEVTPQKEIVWSYHCPTNTQIHALQPIGLDKVMVVENGLPPHLYIFNKADGSKAVDHELPMLTNSTKSIHTQFRNCRVTAQGNYLLPFLDGGFVLEYDKDWNLLASNQVGRAWSAVRLNNGNMLIPGDQRGYVHEINPQGEIVWDVESNSLPELVLRDVQTADRLANGNTIICNRGGSAKGVALPQVVEVTPDKKVVWALQDYKNLPSCTGVQLLDEPGIPEKPGDLQR